MQRSLASQKTEREVSSSRAVRDGIQARCRIVGLQRLIGIRVVSRLVLRDAVEGVGTLEQPRSLLQLDTGDWAIELTASVGRGGSNLPGGVDAVVSRLRQLGFDTGDLLEGVAAAIEAYPRDRLQFQHPDGRIDPGGRTQAALKADGGKPHQLALDPKPARIVVLVRKRRPAYQSLSHAAAAFVHLIEKRVEALRASINPDHNTFGESASAGDPDTYANVVNHKFQITDANGKERDFGAYNADKGYANLVKRQIAAARADLPGS
jgi:hypothetical protein